MTSLDIKLIDKSNDNESVRPVKFHSIFTRHDRAINTEDQESNPEIGIPIIKLKTHQRVKMTMQAQKGIGKMHAKYSPVSVASFRFDPRVRLDDAKVKHLPPETKKNFAAICPRKVFLYDEKSDNLTVQNESRCVYCGECEKFAV